MHLNKIITIILLSGFIVPLITLVFISYCDEGNISDCLLKIEPLMPDFYWHYNTIKFIAAYGSFPDYVVIHKDGGYDGISESGEMKPVFHGPTYYYLGAGIFVMSKIHGINPLLPLHIFSLLLMLTGNFIFFLLLKRLSKYTQNKKQFVIAGTSLSVFLPLNLYISVAIHNHALFYLLAILSFYMYVLFLQYSTLKNSVFLGLVLGLSLLTSIGGLILIAVLGIHCIYNYFKKNRENNLFLLSLILGVVIGSYTHIRNYILFKDIIWGGIKNFGERNPVVILRAMKSYFGGIYGGYDLFSSLIWIISILIIVVGVYGIIKSELWKKQYSFIWMVGLLTILLGINTVCNIQYINHFINNFSCIGTNLLHGRYFLLVGPALILFFSLGFVNLFKERVTTKYFLLGFICLIYLIDFIYALV